MWQKTPKGIVIQAKIKPNQKQDKIVGPHHDRIKILLTATPEKGKANQHLIQFLSDQFGIPKKQIVIVSGELSSLKRILFQFPVPEILLDSLKTWSSSLS